MFVQEDLCLSPADNRVEFVSFEKKDKKRSRCERLGRSSVTKVLLQTSYIKTSVKSTSWIPGDSRWDERQRRRQVFRSILSQQESLREERREESLARSYPGRIFPEKISFCSSKLESLCLVVFFTTREEKSLTFTSPAESSSCLLLLSYVRSCFLFLSREKRDGVKLYETRGGGSGFHSRFHFLKSFPFLIFLVFLQSQGWVRRTEAYLWQDILPGSQLFNYKLLLLFAIFIPVAKGENWPVSLFIPCLLLLLLLVSSGI